MSNIPVHAELQHVSDNTYRLRFCDRFGFVTDIHEFTGKAISNGFNPFKYHPNVETLKIDWDVDFGRAKKLHTKLMKGILQHG
jgi:hypothetical protein